MKITVLLTLTIQNYTLAERLELDFKSGTSAITGETGAGKSLILDALGMALGDRADSDTIRHGANSAVVAAQFDLPIYLRPASGLRRENSALMSVSCVAHFHEMVAQKAISTASPPPWGSLKSLASCS